MHRVSAGSRGLEIGRVGLLLLVFRVFVQACEADGLIAHLDRRVCNVSDWKQAEVGGAGW